MYPMKKNNTLILKVSQSLIITTLYWCKNWGLENFARLLQITLLVVPEEVIKGKKETDFYGGKGASVWKTVHSWGVEEKTVKYCIKLYYSNAIIY